MKRERNTKSEYQYEYEIENAAMNQIPIIVDGKKYQNYKPEMISSFLQEQSEDYMAGYLIDENGSIVLIEYNKVQAND